jgi:hypothetical protein
MADRADGCGSTGRRITTVLPTARTTQQPCPYAHVVAVHPRSRGFGTTTLAEQPGKQHDQLDQVFTCSEGAKSVPVSRRRRFGANLEMWAGPK